MKKDDKKKNIVKKTIKKFVSKEKKKKNDSLPMNKFSKTMGIIVGSLLLILIILAILSNISIDIANFVWLYIRNPIFGFLFKVFSIYPTAGIMFPIIMVLITFIYLVFILFFELRKSIKYKVRLLCSNFCLGLMFVNLFLMLMPTLFTMSEFGFSKINYQYFNENVNAVYKKEDLIELNKYYQEKILSLADNFDRENGMIIYENDLLDTAVNNLLRVSNKYKFLKGLYPNKVDSFTKLEHESNVDQTVGYTMGYGIKVDNEGDKVMTLHVLTHELCHTKGLVRENETEFCAYIAGINGDYLSKYAAYLNSLSRVNYALYMIDGKIAYDIEEPILNLCLTKQYNEICNYYSKEVNHYINDSYMIEISSNRLRNYKNYFDEFSSVLTTLQNEYKARFYVGKEKDVSIGAIQAEIINESDKTLFIEIDIDEKKFEKLSSYLIANDKFFVSIYQINEDTEEPDSRSPEEASEYYLSPFENKSDFILSYSDKFMEEYDYEKVTRLLLEYHHTTLKERLLSK